MIKLIGNKVAITPINDPDKSAGGIWIPDQAKERCDQGIVKYIGPKVKWCKQGMYVAFSGYTGELFIMEGEGRVIIMPEDFIVCEISNVENVFVPGLFFKQRINKNIAISELKSLLNSAFESRYEEFISEFKLEQIAEILVDHGVTGPSANPYFEADYEHIMEFLAEAFRDSDWYKELKINVPKPKYTDNKMEPV